MFVLLSAEQVIRISVMISGNMFLKKLIRRDKHDERTIFKLTCPKNV